MKNEAIEYALVGLVILILAAIAQAYLPEVEKFLQALLTKGL